MQLCYGNTHNINYGGNTNMKSDKIQNTKNRENYNNEVQYPESH